ncbi:MAG: penicillin-binding protein 2 [bacterium]
MNDNNDFFNVPPLNRRGGVGGKKFGEEWSEDITDPGLDGQATIRPLFNYKKLRYLAIILFLPLLIIFGRLVYLQGYMSDSFMAQAEENRIRKIVVRAPRGIIYDRYGEILVKNVPSFDLEIVPFDVPKDDSDRESQFYTIASEAKISLDEIVKAYEEKDPLSHEPVLIKEGIEREEALTLETNLQDITFAQIAKNPIREYIEPELYAHILGYMGKLTKEEFDANRDSEKEYLFNDYIGKNGLEYYYEDYLRGYNGVKYVEVDVHGREKNVIASKEGVAGDDVVLEIDAGLQDRILQALNDSMSKMNLNKGVVIASDPITGEILAMVSLPSFDNNNFARGISQDDYNNLINNTSKPLLNRAIQGTYPPGSTIKPVVAAAALQENIVSAGTIIVDRGAISVPNKYNPDIVYEFVGWDRSGLGAMTVTSAIAKSSDIYFYTVAGGDGDIKGLGVKKLADYYENFNLGKKVGIDLPGEESGLVPNPDWKEEVIGEAWYQGDTYHMGIGQGDVLTTPLQVLHWTASIANHGNQRQPHLLKKTINTAGEENNVEPKTIKKNFISDTNMDYVRQGMKETVEYGSGVRLKSLPVSAGGKTGTAQFSNNESTHAWFTAFAPFDNPEIAIVVLVEGGAEGGGEGHDTAVPVAYDVLNWYFTEGKQREVIEK